MVVFRWVLYTGGAGRESDITRVASLTFHYLANPAWLERRLHLLLPAARLFPIDRRLDQSPRLLVGNEIP